MHSSIKKLLKEIIFRSPLRRHFFPYHAYNFTVPQLLFICKCLEDSRVALGCIAEIGVAQGQTTLFLNKYMDAAQIEKPYFSVDTFEGFTEKDIHIEVSQRSKRTSFYTGYNMNKQKWYDGTMRMNSISRVKSIKADINTFDLQSLGPLSFAILDVDLYRPMKKGLCDLVPILSPGGVLIVDDCDPTNERWDGASQAYREYTEENGLPFDVQHQKLGVIRKPVST